MAVIDERSWKDRFMAALREKHQLLFDPETGRLRAQYSQHTDCPVCEANESELLFTKDGFRHVQCRRCSMVYLNPRLNDAATYEFYNGQVNAIYNESKFDTVSSSTRLDDEANLFNLMMIERYRETREKGKLLEVGSGKGYFLHKAKEQGYQVYGLELNVRNYLLTREQLGDSIYNMDLLQAQFAPKMFDVIYMRDVIEHLPNPKPFFQELHRITKDGGVVFVETHNIDSFINQITRQRHTVIFGFEHPNHWSPKSLETILTWTGFQVIDIKHTSLDFTVQEILGYFLNPSFTTIFPVQMDRSLLFILRAIRKPFSLWPLRHVDSRFTPQIANVFKRGSVIKVLTRKAVR
jgi:2-polyprenyl-3-methyl-5-hydroxy-6-metoxy-1,4-benzoquinol methylase